MSRYYLQIRLLLLLFLSLSAGAWPQQSPSAGSSLSLEQIASRAGLIFSGTVQAIEPDGDSVTSVTFKVEEGIRGARPDETVTIREWAGPLRAGTPGRYRVGEKVLVFFHSAAPNGLTSPVGGSAGVIRFGGPESLKFTDEQSRALARSPRLRTVVRPADGQNNGNILPVADIIRALRLVTNSQ